VFQHPRSLVTVQIDDDCHSLQANTGPRPRRLTDPEQLRAIFLSTAQACHDARTCLFGFGDKKPPLHSRPDRPFSFTTVVDQVVGVIGTDVLYDEAQVAQADMDATLRELYYRRLVWIDNRFTAVCAPRFDTPGGLQGHRTSQNRQADIERIRTKWGPVIDSESGAGKHSTNTMKVKR
jgi:hypothetical protein